MADLLDGGIDGPYNETDPYVEIERLREVIEDAIETLESMDLHTDNPLYDRLVSALPPSHQTPAENTGGGQS